MTEVPPEIDLLFGRQVALDVIEAEVYELLAADGHAEDLSSNVGFSMVQTAAGYGILPSAVDCKRTTYEAGR